MTKIVPYANKKVAIITHFYTTGPATRLEQYLVDQRINEIHFLAHPFSFSKDTASFLRVYKKGTKIYDQKYNKFTGPEVIFYLRDLLTSLIWGLKQEKIDLLICFDGLNTFSGLILKLFGKVDTLVFYTIDYVPLRFANRILNRIYHFLDWVGVAKADLVWNVSSQIAIEREKNGFKKEWRSKQIVVPITIETIPSPTKLDMKYRNNIVYMGHLRKNQGLENLLKAVNLVKQKIKSVRLTIIGGGPLEKKLRNYVVAHKLSKHVKFTGFIENFKDVEKVLRQQAVSVAPYDNADNSFTKFADPGKPKDYLAHGLPVIITNIPSIARTIRKRNAGIVITNNNDELVNGILLMLKTKEYNIYRENAFRLAKLYLSDVIFKKALLKTQRLTSNE